MLLTGGAKVQEDLLIEPHRGKRRRGRFHRGTIPSKTEKDASQECVSWGESSRGNHEYAPSNSRGKSTSSPHVLRYRLQKRMFTSSGGKRGKSAATDGVEGCRRCRRSASQYIVGKDKEG